MKKTIISLVTIFIVAFAAFAASNWVCVQDTCGKCVINDTDRECGKCGGFMNGGRNEVKGKYLQSTYTCKKCGHKAIYKYKYQN